MTDNIVTAFFFFTIKGKERSIGRFPSPGKSKLATISDTYHIEYIAEYISYRKLLLLLLYHQLLLLYMRKVEKI